MTAVMITIGAIMTRARESTTTAAKVPAAESCPVLRLPPGPINDKILARISTDYLHMIIIII